MTVTSPQAIATTTGANKTTISFTPTAVGSCLVVCALAANISNISPNSITDNKGFITWTQVGTWYRSTSPPSGNGRTIWLGVVGAGGNVATTITVGFSASVTSVNTEITVQELKSSTPVAWSVDGTMQTFQKTTSSTTVTMPTCTTTQTGEIYYGYGNVSNTASTSGQTSGYTAFSTTTNGNLILYNLNVTTVGSQSPTARQSASGASAMAAFIIKTSTPTTTVALAQAAESDSAAALAWLKSQNVGPASRENDSAYQLSKLKTQSLSRGSETTTAYALTPKKAGVTVNLAKGQETDTAYGFTWAKIKGILSATTNTVAYAMGHIKTYPPLSRASESDTAYPLSHSKVKGFPSASESDRAYAFTIAKKAGIDTGHELTTAYALRASQPNNIRMGVARETDTAFPMTPVQYHPPWILQWWFKHRMQRVPYYSERPES